MKNKIVIPSEGVYSQIGVARQSAHSSKVKYGFDFYVMKNRIGFYVSNEKDNNKLIYSTENLCAQ